MRIILVFIFLTLNAAFAMVQPVSDAELQNAAEDIVKATVLSQTCEWNQAETVIFTFVKIRVEKVYKGDMKTQSLQTLAIPGGYDPKTDLRLTVSSQPTFEIGEQSVFYLSPARGIADGINYQLFQARPDFSRLKRVNYFSMGKHEISTDSQDGQEIIFKANDREFIDLEHYENMLEDQLKTQRRRNVK